MQTGNQIFSLLIIHFSLRYFAADDATDTRWIDGLREITSARQNVTVPTDSQSEQRQQQPDSLLQEQGGNKNDVNNYHQPQDISQQDEHNPMSSRFNYVVIL